MVYHRFPVEAQNNHAWPIFVQDRQGHAIYLTWERWEHALGHPGMDEGLLESVLETLRQGRRKQDPYDAAKHKYLYDLNSSSNLYTRNPVSPLELLEALFFGGQSACSLRQKNVMCGEASV